MPNGPNYAALFRAAVKDSVRDYYALHREKLTSGFWLIRHNKRSPLVPARTFWTTADPYFPWNELDRWPLPYLAGEICGQIADPLDIFGAPWRTPLGPKHDLTVEERYQYLCADAAHAKVWRRDEPEARPRQRVDLSRAKALF